MTSRLAEASRAFWENRTDAHHRHGTEEWFKRYADELLAFLPAGGTLLDVGCGACQVTSYLAPHYERVVAVDSSESMLTAARDRNARLHVTNVTLVRADATDLRGVEGPCDVILAFSVLQYLDAEALDRHFAECRRLLSVSGSICWGQIPDARLKLATQLGLLSQPTPSAWVLVRRLFQLLRSRLSPEYRADPLADGIGRWFDPLHIQDLAAQAGFECELRRNWYYENRFHALLRARSAAATG